MSKLWNTFLLLLVLYAIGLQSVHAQNMANGSFAVSPGFALANCPSTSIAGMTTFCPVGTGQIYYCLSTTATCASSTAGWVLINGNAPTLTINGTEKTLPASFTIAVTQGAPVTTPTVTSYPAPTVSAN